MSPFCLARLLRAFNLKQVTKGADIGKGGVGVQQDSLYKSLERHGHKERGFESNRTVYYMPLERHGHKERGGEVLVS